MKRLYVQGMAVGAVALAATSGQWLAFAASPPAARVHFAGCVKPGVEPNCLIIENDGQIYNVSSAKDVLKIGQFAAGTGIPGGMSYCQQGSVLTSVVLDNPQPLHADCGKETKPTASH